MVQLARSLPRPPPAPLAPDPAVDAISRYLDATAAQLARTLALQLATFVEPRPAVAPERAIELLGLLVETLAGCALGCVAGQLARVVQRRFGDPIRARVGRVLGELAHAGTEPRRLPAGVGAARATSQPLIDELGGQLHVRLAAGRADLRSFATAIHEVIGELAPDRRHAFAQALELARDDDAIALRFADHLALGWQVYRAALAGQAPPPARSSIAEMWVEWSGRARGGQARAVERSRDAERHDVAAGHYLIMIR